MKSYCPAIFRQFSPQRMNSSRIHHAGQSFSLLAIQEEVKNLNFLDPVCARRVKVLRIEQTAVHANQYVRPHSQARVLSVPPPQLEAELHRESFQSQSKPRELEGFLEGKPVRLRSVGNVAKDEVGNFYEVQGEQLRQLGELVMDEWGRIFEVCVSGETKPASVTPAKSNGRATDPAQTELPNCTNGSQVTARPPAPEHQKNGATPQPQAKKSEPEIENGYRKIFDGAGVRLKLPYARIKSEMASQLKHPEKLNDNDLVECYAQIYESQREMPIAKIAAAEFGNETLHHHLHPFTQDKARLFGTPQLFKPTSHPYETLASIRQIYPGQRVYSLCPIFDPTVEHESTSVKPLDVPVEKSTPMRHQIPMPHLNPQQFKYSREEVLYDMKTILGTLPPDSGGFVRWTFIYPLRLLKTLIIWLISGTRMKKWRAMLAGKSFDEQLWGVTPPSGFAYHPTVRRWAAATLAQAGYDTEHMMLEWEILWRRRGFS